MTTVVAYASPTGTFMAADTMTNVYDRPVFGVAKVIRCRTTSGDGSYLLGFAGDGALPPVLASHHTVQCLPDFTRADSRNNWASSVAQAITEVAIEHLLLDDGRMGSSVLLAGGGYLWTVVHQQAIPHADGVGAIGSGEGPAIGALHALIGVGMEPASAVRTACATGIHFDRYSGGRVRLLHLPPRLIPSSAED